MYLKNNETSQSYYDSFFFTTNLDWRKIYVLWRKTTMNTKLRVFQYEISHNVWETFEPNS